MKDLFYEIMFLLILILSIMVHIRYIFMDSELEQATFGLILCIYAMVIVIGAKTFYNKQD